MYSVEKDGYLVLYDVPYREAMEFMKNSEDLILWKKDLEKQKIHGAGSWFLETINGT